MSSGQIIFFSVLLYAALCVFIGAKGKSISSSNEGFFVGGRSFGIIMTVCTVVMGIYSGLTFYGFPAMVFRGGMGVIAATAFGTIGVLYPFFGYRLWRIGKDRGYMTTADFLRDRYYSEGYGALVSTLQLVFVVPYVALQLVVVGSGLSFSSNNYVSYTAAIIFFGAFLALYLFIGGAKGIGWLDIFNAALAIFIPIVAIVIVINKNFGGSWTLMGETALTNFPNMMDLPSFGMVYSPINILALMIVGIIATFTSPAILPKFYMVKNKKTFQQMSVAGPVLYTWLGLSILLLALLGIALYKPVLSAAQSDILVPKLILENTPTIIVIGMLWVLFAYATSTANAFALSASTILSKDFLGRYAFKNIKDQKAKDSLTLKLGKYGVVLILILGIIVALEKPVYIVDYAYKLSIPGFAQILPALIFGMYWKRASKEAAITGTVAGLLTLVYTAFINPSPLEVSPIIWSLAVNFGLFFLVTFVTEPPKEIVETFHLKYETETREVSEKVA